jgi:hypothetical protein
MSTIKKIFIVSMLAVLIAVFNSPVSLGQSMPFILGSELGGPPVFGLGMAPWAFGTQSCVTKLPLYFGAHGFGFPISLGCYRIGFIPSC